MSKSTPLQPGDKIRFVGPVYHGGLFCNEPHEAEIIWFTERNHMLKVKVINADGQPEGEIHRRQVVARIRKKAPAAPESEKLEAWAVRTTSGSGLWLLWNKPEAPVAHLIEIREGEAIVSREALESERKLSIMATNAIDGGDWWRDMLDRLFCKEKR